MPVQSLWGFNQGEDNKTNNMIKPKAQKQLENKSVAKTHTSIDLYSSVRKGLLIVIIFILWHLLKCTNFTAIVINFANIKMLFQVEICKLTQPYEGARN